MPSLSEAQRLGLSENVQALYENQEEELTQGGLNAKTLLVILQTVHQEYVDLNNHQENLKRQLKETTIRLRTLGRRLYNLTSGLIDAAMMAVEKNSPAAKIIQRLRSHILRPPKDDVVSSSD